MTETLVLHIGGSFDDDRARILAAAHRAESGQPITPEAHISFENWPLFFRTMTPTRVDILREVHAHPPRSVRALALTLGRDYRRVHADVAALVAAGLLARHGTGLTAGFDIDWADITAA